MLSHEVLYSEYSKLFVASFEETLSNYDYEYWSLDQDYMLWSENQSYGYESCT